MKYLSLILILFCCSLANAQKTDTVQYINKEVLIDRPPQYPKGEMALYQYIYQNLNYPEEARKHTLNTQITINWVVLPDSTVTDIKVLKGAGYGVDEEVVKLIKSQKFLPCIQEGKIVKMNMVLNLPIQRRADEN